MKLNKTEKRVCDQRTVFNLFSKDTKNDKIL